MKSKVYNYIRIGGIYGAIAVLMGALGSHFLKGMMKPDDVPIYQTAVDFQFIHALGLLFIGLKMKKYPRSVRLNNAGKLFTFGVILFSGSLYLLTLIRTLEDESLDLLGSLTPFGGGLLIIGWIVISLGVPRKKGKQADEEDDFF